jgi:hypothetical protein
MISYGGLSSPAVLRVQAAPFVIRLGARSRGWGTALTQETRCIMVLCRKGQKSRRLYNISEGNPDKRDGN